MAGLQGDVAALVAQVTTLQGQVAGLGRDMNAGWLVICGACLPPPCCPSSPLTSLLGQAPWCSLCRRDSPCSRQASCSPKTLPTYSSRFLFFALSSATVSLCWHNERCPVSNAMSGALARPAEGLTPLIAESTGKIAQNLACDGPAGDQLPVLC